MGTIFRYVLKCLYSCTAQSLIFAIMATMIVVFFRKEGVKKSVELWWNEIKKINVIFVQFLFFVYTYIMATITLFNREMVWDATEKVLDGWWTCSETETYVKQEALGNLLLFVPFVFLLYCAWGRELKRGKFIRDVYMAFKISMGCSLFIELNQLFFRIGTFQVSDLTYNAVGGIIGFVMWYIWMKMKEGGDNVV